MAEHGYQPGISIREAINNIDESRYVLPGIQRKFVWKPDQIELLFDSIIRDYPINSLMLWKISSTSLKNEYKFFCFLKSYIEKYGEENVPFNATGIDKDFYAIIDGQQRLNSLYIGLKGTYAKRKKNKSAFNDENFPKMKLYLDIKSQLEAETEIDKEYDFKFLKEEDAVSNNKTGEVFWYEVGNILKQTSASERFHFGRL